MLSSFLIGTLVSAKDAKTLQRKRADSNCLKENVKQADISAISLLYQYTNPPPLAHGSPAPKVAESILRSHEYNKLPNQGRGDEKHQDRQYWTKDDGEFPSDMQEPSSNICLPAMKKYCLDFLKLNYLKIDKMVESVVNDLYNENADVLTKGRQTWEPFMQRSVPSAEAYREMADFFKKNTGKCNFNMLEWIQTWSSLFEKDVLHINCKEITKEKINKVSKYGSIVSREKTKVKTVSKTLHGADVNICLLGIASEFCSYLKSKERSKLKRRAIASANMILRMFFEVIERFHLGLGKIINGSTIAQGGIEKQDKIMTSLNNLQRKNYNLLATEDATKWNECLSPAGFLVMHEIFLDPKYRTEASVVATRRYDQYKLLKEIMHTGIFLLSRKEVFIGQGHIMEDGDTFTRERWFGVDKNKLNERTRNWYEKIEKDLSERDCIYSPYGMLMGMLNAGSTTYGLVAMTGLSNDVSCVRSSDDSITLFTCSTDNGMWPLLMKAYWRYKLIGINISLKKTRFFRWPFGEYTSWYMDGDFSAQYGVEISAIRPKGDTPHTDFHSSAIETNVALRELRINNIGAEMMLALKISNTRRLWRINMRANDPLEKVRLLADGGNSPWHSTNSNLAEIAIRFEQDTNPEEREYLYKVCNPNNPFSTKEKEKLMYSHELGAVIEGAIDIPRNMFCYIRRPNKTLKSNFKAKEKKEMDACKMLVDLLECLDPTCAILKPSRGTVIAEYVSNIINHVMSMGRLYFSEDEEISHQIEYITNYAKEVFGDIPLEDD